MTAATSECPDALRRQQAILTCVSRLLSLYAGESDSETLFDAALNDILALTGSQYGFIAELEQEPDGAPCLQALAITNIAWDDATRAFHASYAPSGFRFRGMDSLATAALHSRAPVIANDPANDPRSGGRLPPGHPSLTTFLGLPLLRSGEAVGAIGLANRAGGYDQVLADALQPVAEACARLLEAYRSQRERRRMEEALRLYERMVSVMPDHLSVVDRDYRYLTVNAAYLEHHGLNREEIVGRTVADLLGQERFEGMVREKLDACLAGERVHYQGWFDFHASGRHYMDVTYTPHADAGGRVTGVVVASRDITELMGTFKELAQAETRLRQAAAVFENAQEGIMVTDGEARILAVNPAFCAITGYREADVLGETPARFKSGRHDAAFYQEMWETLARTGRWQGEVWDRRKDGEIFPNWLSISAVAGDQGQAAYYVALFADITRLKKSEARLEHLAHYDPLTDLPNRLLFSSRLDHALELARRHHSRLAVLYLDLDRFKAVNDSQGHAAGDELLVLVARRLRARLRDEDTLARLGGDEFILLLEQVETSDQVAVVAQDLLQVLAHPLRLSGDQVVHIGGSIGVSFYPEDGDAAEALVGRADAALYQAKAAGGNTCRFHTQPL